MSQLDPTTKGTKETALTALDSLKAKDVTVLDVRDRASFTDLMIFASGSSKRHVSAIAGAVIEAAEQNDCPLLGAEGADIGEWALVDLGDVIIHVMLSDVREYYDLENLWSEELASS